MLCTYTTVCVFVPTKYYFTSVNSLLCLYQFVFSCGVFHFIITLIKLAAKIEEIANLWNEVLSMKETNDELDTDSTTMNEELEK